VNAQVVSRVPEIVRRAELGVQLGERLVFNAPISSARVRTHKLDFQLKRIVILAL